jgi:hypothetical protein
MFWRGATSEAAKLWASALVSTPEPAPMLVMMLAVGVELTAVVAMLELWLKANITQCSAMLSAYGPLT